MANELNARKKALVWPAVTIFIQPAITFIAERSHRFILKHRLIYIDDFSISFNKPRSIIYSKKTKIPQSSNSPTMLSRHVGFLENFKRSVGVRVDGCLCLCGPEVNWQLIQGVTCPRPAIAGCCLQHGTIPHAGQRWRKMNGRMSVKWIIKWRSN